MSDLLRLVRKINSPQSSKGMRFAFWTGQKDVLMQRRGYWIEILVGTQTRSSSNCLVLIKPTAPPARSSFYFLNVL